jgi:hypothetical protein
VKTGYIFTLDGAAAGFTVVCTASDLHGHGPATWLADQSERVMLMGGACAKAYGWSPTRR